MEFIDGVKKKDTLDIHDILESGFEGEEIRINGAVHSIRDMGEVAFVIPQSPGPGAVRIRTGRYGL